MDKPFLKFFGSTLIISVFFFLFSLQSPAAALEKPGIVRKKILKKIESTERTAAKRNSKSHLQKTSLYPRSDISAVNTPAGNDHIYAANSKKGNATRPPYNTEGKVDPFKPVFSAEPEKHKGPVEPVIDRPDSPTAIEKFHLSQLKLTGIVLAESGNKGIVREPAGMGHIVTIGTYIGTFGGKVVTITKDTVIVEEKWKNYTGSIDIKRKEMRLIKNTGKL